MSFFDTLKDALDEDIVITHEFLLSYNPGNRIVHAFFEGKTDESFYASYVRSMVPSGWHLKTYVCNNKDGVYYHFDQLKERYSKVQPLLFFVDKDVEDIVPFDRAVNDMIYVTGYYSVENYVVTVECFERIWAEIFKQGSGDAVASELAELFKRALSTVHEIFVRMMAWVIYHRRLGSKPNLDCIITKRLFEIDESLKLTPRYNSDSLISHLDERTKISTSKEEYPLIDLVEQDELLKYEPKKVVRGHNEMEFLIEFYKKVKSVASEASGNKIKPQPDITASNALDVLGPRTPCPQSLMEFLKHHLEGQMELI